MKLKKDSQIMWEPTQNGKTQIDEFRSQINSKFGACLENYEDLWKWSVNNYASFWEEFWHFSRVKYSQIYEQVIDPTKNIEDIPQWFQGSRLNFAENLLQGNENDVAIYAAGERRKLEAITFGELKERVRMLASALKNSGVRCGDRVVGYIPNCSLAVEAMLATASLGAIWSSTSPDFGVTGVLDRFSQIKPKVIFSVDAVVYNDKIHGHLPKLRSVVQELPDLEKVIVMPYVKAKEEIDITGIPNSMYLEDFLLVADAEPATEFEQVPFNHPLFIMYSSGTTGAPKCMVHSAGGTLIQHLKEHILHGDMRKDDIILYYSTTGWMMWNWLVSALAIGSSVVLYDGSPFVPSPMVLWDLVDKIGITILGTGARWLEALEERSIRPMKSLKLHSLRCILSTGSPLKPYSYEYVYSSIKKDLLLGSITGGTDIISCFAGQNPTLPVYKGEIQSVNLGMAMESWDEEGKPVFDKPGELVCTKPFPSMPICFWNDPDGKKYNKAYFGKFPGVWGHGDFCQINSETGGIVMLGRSDGTLNPNGVRFGSAEIYNIVESTAFPEIADSLCVAHTSKNGERVVLFLKMADDNLTRSNLKPGLRISRKDRKFTDSLVKRVQVEIRRNLSARHVPNVILPTLDIPYTTSGKKVEVAVKRILSGEHVTQRGALINPDSLDLYYNISELQESS